MPLPVPSGFDPTQKTPVIAVGIEFGSAGAAIGGPKKILILDQKTSAGTILPNVPTRVYSTPDAQAKCGIKSNLAQDCAKIFAQNPNANVWVSAVPEGPSAVAATATLAFATNASSAGVVRLWFRGRPLVEIAVANGDTPTAIAAAVSAAFNKRSDWPATASPSTGTVTFTAANKGPKGNQLALRCELTFTGTTVALNGGTPASSVDGRFGTDSATAGSVADDIADALTAIAAVRYDFIVCSSTDSTNLGKLKTHLSARFAIGERIRQQGVIAFASGLSTAKTAIGNQNFILFRTAWHYNAEETEGELAAAHCAACLYGDSVVGGGIGKSSGEVADCSANLNGTMIADILEQHLEADRPTPPEVEDALNNGLTPLVPSAANTGYVEIVRSITSRFKDSSGNPVYDTLDSGIVSTMIEVADRLEAVTRAKYPNKKLRPNPTNLTGPTNPKIVFPYMLERTWFEELKTMEDETKLINVDALRSKLKAEQSNVNPTLIVGQVDASVIPIFNGAAIRLIQDTPFFLPQ